MSENTFELPHNSPVEPTRLELEDKLKFRCHKDISCWNQCCAQADVSLAPYDIIRMKTHLGISSTDFLKDYTVPYEIDSHNVPGIKLRTTEARACLFMKESGCSIYEDRPTACRYYPSGLLSMRALGMKEDERHFLLIKEPHCKGHDEAREITIADYRKEQAVEEFDDLNRDWYRIILKKKSTGPTIGKPSEMSLQLFFMASYDVDRFRRFILSDSFKKMYDVSAEEFARFENDDVALMQFGFALMKQVLFGEMSIKERTGAGDQRAEERKEVLAYRKEAELNEHNRKQEEARKAALEEGDSPASK
ncbi:hypothetical protein MNBD_GAMMA11-1149 [hydrothermal vent metagenome]|uniref:Fe-S-cluster oxidoreductase n=1 Tax=hydrothermal vent metagenome TaxID=652676 RepID=A0A3B0XDF5_9ZZZZ